MRFIKIKNALLFTSLAAVVAMGCKKEDFAVNTNPDDVTASTVDFKAVLPASISATATIQANQWAFLQRWLGYWARSGSYQDATDEESYDFTNDFGSGLWNNLFANANNYNFVQSVSHEREAGFYEAIARIMKAQDFQMLVDIYGNIPYSEAFKGGSIRTPKYDEDLDIYKDLFRQLDTAITLLKGPSASVDNNPGIAINDLVFQGNATNWIKYANTLKLRLIIHTCNTTFTGSTEVNTFVAGIDQAAEMAKITAEGSGFLGAGLNAQINPGYNDTKPNPFYRAYQKTETGAVAGAGDYTKANAYAVGPTSLGNFGYYGWNGDPRVDKFYVKPGTATTHRGITYGELASVNAANTGSALSNIYGTGLLPNGAASRAWIFTGFESLFLQAEAAKRGLLPVGNTKALYTAAVRESFVWLGLTTAQADAYLANNAGYVDVDIDAPPLGPGLPPGGIYTIMSQKWFALNAVATLEIWTDHRRTNMAYGVGSGFIKGPPISINPANTKTALPIRLFYPQAEYSLNAANAGAQGTINVFTGGGISGKNRIFWDQN